ncbi:MAG: pirin family protein [Actinomycetota bacterium]|nr:pirin family protein [Actinomycetota bacterium]
MIEVRRDRDIHREEGGWFTARWHFSFDRYRDPQNMGIGPLRVFNDDRLVPGAVWPLHPHRDIEGLTYVVEGSFRHEDDQGNDGVLPAGSVQRMTLGSGAWHSEQNASQAEPMRFIQIWILPHTADLPPSCEQRVFTEEDRTGQLLEVFSPKGGPGVEVHGDASVYVSRLPAGDRLKHDFAAGRGGYLYLIEGEVSLNGQLLHTGDAAKISGEAMELEASADSELILVDVPLHYQPVGVWAR